MSYLLNIDANAKTVKGQKHGYLTAVMYLAPYKLSGYNVCPAAELAGCWIGCLNTSGHGGMSKGNKRYNPHGIEIPENNVQKARIRRTRMWMEDRAAFWVMLLNEINRFIKSAARKGLTPVIRLNGTSDIRWEREEVNLHSDKTIFEIFPDIQFYDYTKLTGRMRKKMPDNYYLCLSYSGKNVSYASVCWMMHEEHGASLIVVCRDKVVKQRWIEEKGAIDGDEHDLRFTDPPGALVMLKAKGVARKETNGFVVD